jgi:chromosome segregation protein
VHFSRLRLSGFKSFVEATDFRIEPGLTGVVGPNGCGKSNLLEALRWVMGANSAKAMRGEGMDDVIFSGSGGRPGRNHAEVTLTIDNADKTAPAAFNAHPVLEVARRIDRGEGSTFRINGAEVRARDVQLLFADASTGANSPALVRQGQISELIAAKPQNRRRILEEAAGVSGLHGRRHEAELRVGAAQANLSRLDDLGRELETNLTRLRREARHAAKYKTLAAEIRGLQSAVLHARWAEARSGVVRLEGEGAQTAMVAERTALAAAAASTAAANAEAAIKPRRDEETVAAAVLHRLDIDKDRLERALESAAGEVQRLIADLARLNGDAAREAQVVEDAAAAVARARREITEVEGEIAAAPERVPALAEAARAAESRRAGADGAVEALAGQAAAAEARARAGEARLEEARGRLARTLRALAQAQGERAALGPASDPKLVDEAIAVARADAALTEARRALEAAEAAHMQAASAENVARIAARRLEDELGRRLTEARGLAQLAAAPVDTEYPSALESVALEAGLEAALAAALGDELNAALDPRAAAFWAGRTSSAPARPPDWPTGAKPLEPLIAAPAELATRLAFTALVDRADGARLQGTLPPGARLVSREGDLWRWDGFTVTAEAPRPAQVRLEQKSRLAALQIEIDRLEPESVGARADHAAAASGVEGADAAVSQVRAAARTAEVDLARAREAAQRLEREGARRDAQIQSLTDTIARFEVERDEAQDALAAATAAAIPVKGDDDLARRLTDARAEAQAAREAAAVTRAALDVEVREREARTGRFSRLRDDLADWSARAQAAVRRQGALTEDRARMERELAAARTAPLTVEDQRARLMDELALAEARRAKSGDALAAAETIRAEADRAARAAAAAGADAREAHAGARVRLEGARERLIEHAAALVAATGRTVAELERELAEGNASAPPDAAGAETRLATLERERDAIGPVNLMAEGDAADLAARLLALNAERGDLAGALSRLRAAIAELNAEGRERLMAAFTVIDGHFRALFTTLFQGGQAELRLVESEDPLEAGLEIYACPPGKRMAVMSLMSGGEQALTAVALIFAVFLAHPAPICVLDEVDAPLDDANVERLCNLLAEMRTRAPTRFVVITHNPLTMSRMDRLYGVTMREKGVSQLVSVDLLQAEAMAAQ